ncbi:hypothetical protein LTR49_028649, partial [Elasticomyces elasticus]
MESLVETYGESYLFKGKTPNKPRQQLKVFMQTLGISPSTASRSIPRLQHWSSITLYVRQPLLDVLRKRYSVRDGKRKSSDVLEDVEAVLKRNDGRPKTELRARILRRWKTHKKLDPVDMLFLLAALIQEEEHSLHFDFISSNGRCLELLRRLRSRIVE